MAMDDRAGTAIAGMGQFHQALTAFAAGDFAQAAAAARSAAQAAPQNRVFAAAVAYLERVLRDGKQGVYVSGEAFAAFIRGGGNIGLYAATSAALQAVYAEFASLRLLDIGVGDGMALLPALSPAIAELQLVEPSAALLERTLAGLRERNVAAMAFGGTLQAFMQQHSGRWDLAQATYSLQSLPPAERQAALFWLREHCDRLLIVEFDAPAACAVPLTPECVAYVLARYEVGLAEYESDGGAVAQGFLMPVMFGYFDPGADRTTYEQPISAWERDLHRAGFQQVRSQALFRYWWATAYLLDASHPA